MRRPFENLRGLFTVFLIGLVFRLMDIKKPFSGLFKWNEGHYSVTALNFFRYSLFTPMNEYGLDLTTTPIYSWLIYLSFRVFGVHEWAARLPSLIFAMASILLVYLIAHELYDENTALLSSFIVAISPGTIYFSRNIQLESMFTALSMASILFMLYYVKKDGIKWLVASGVSVSLAVATKYPAVLTYPALIYIYIRSGSRRINNLITFLILSLLPALFWGYFAVSSRATLTTWYVDKPDVIWTAGSTLTALKEAFLHFIPEHLGYVFYIPFLLTLPFIVKDGKKHMVILIYTFSWPILIIMFPDFYLSNMYYHYPMQYSMAILLAYYIVKVNGSLIFNGRMKTTLKVMTLCAAIILSLYQYNLLFHSYYTDFSKINESIPFQSAKLVADMQKDGELVVADLPPTMFYLGGDPHNIRLAYTTQGLINAVEENKYDYLVTYYEGNKTLRAILENNNYSQIAPRAWKKG